MKLNKILLALFVPFAMISLCSLHGCSRTVKPTALIIRDSVRHYYPLLQGEQLEIQWEIANVGKDPLVLTAIHPSCGCIEVDRGSNNVILPNKEMTLKFIFDSSKNSGYVEHKIYLYGNIAPDGMAVLVFDTNIVPRSNASPDYEERYYDNEKAERMLKGLTNGFENERGYWIDNGDYPSDYSRSYKKYPWKKDSETK